MFLNITGLLESVHEALKLVNKIEKVDALSSEAVKVYEEKKKSLALFV